MIEFRDITKRFGGAEVLRGISLQVPEGELAVLIGPSGSGKSTLLRMVNGLITPSSGSVWVGGVNVAQTDVVALRRNIGYVIQSVGLFPHLTVAGNVELVPSISGTPAPERRKRALELLELMDLDPAVYAERYPRQLSGGQQQRVGIARALAANPGYLLMDEPFSALDPITRAALQDQFIHLKQKLGKTIVFVTHDIEEALRLGDRICVLGEGVVQQFAPPDELLARPANDFVASFVGENRELLRLGLRRVADIMGAAVPQAEARGDVSADFGADAALALLLDKGGGPLRVLGEGGQVVGSLHLRDFIRPIAAASSPSPQSSPQGPRG